LTTRDTVIAETPARSATSLILLMFAMPGFASGPRCATGGCRGADSPRIRGGGTGPYL
jgi:hypothetical protein